MIHVFRAVLLICLTLNFMACGEDVDISEPEEPILVATTVRDGHDETGSYKYLAIVSESESEESNFPGPDIDGVRVLYAGKYYEGIVTRGMIGQYASQNLRTRWKGAERVDQGREEPTHILREGDESTFVSIGGLGGYLIFLVEGLNPGARVHISELYLQTDSVDYYSVWLCRSDELQTALRIRDTCKRVGEERVSGAKNFLLK